MSLIDLELLPKAKVSHEQPNKSNELPTFADLLSVCVCSAVTPGSGHQFPFIHSFLLQLVYFLNQHAGIKQNRFASIPLHGLRSNVRCHGKNRLAGLGSSTSKVPLLFMFLARDGKTWLSKNLSASAHVSLNLILPMPPTADIIVGCQIKRYNM
ncbi:hypothetical protein V6N13_076827 [Hibiscus sabdariffa]|uniref:Uncharacterized protein n=2 Tax=Hibiscus sabdariffa TaxID=183260 RepID=A0ABR2CM18_9ROSI